jgi:DNA polymerase
METWTFPRLVGGASQVQVKERSRNLPASAERHGWVTLAAVRNEAAHCRRCPLYKDATQTVFGAGSTEARIVIIGEQPGDREDIEGLPFVGPAGKLLDKALREAGIDPAEVYITNAVKHFKHIRQGKRRIHKRPNREEVVACKPWLDAELAAVQPSLVVALGATAAQALMGSSFRVTKQRGVILAGPNGIDVLATVHPSSILRTQGTDARHTAMEAFVNDLRSAAVVIGARNATAPARKRTSHSVA